MNENYSKKIKHGFIKNNYTLQLIVTISAVVITLFGVVIFNNHFLQMFNILERMFLMILAQWSMMIGPIIMMRITKTKLSDLGLTKDKLYNQIIVGVILAIIVSLLFTVIPILLGFKNMVGSTSYTKPWQFIYEFVYCIIGVALAEEFIFRGYIFNILLKIKNSSWFAIITSSLIFGLFHIFNGDIIQMFMTFLLGVMLCLFREKIKNCTLISLVLVHGIHNALITLFVAIL